MPIATTDPNCFYWLNYPRWFYFCSQQGPNGTSTIINREPCRNLNGYLCLCYPTNNDEIATFTLAKIAPLTHSSESSNISSMHDPLPSDCNCPKNQEEKCLTPAASTDSAMAVFMHSACHDNSQNTNVTTHGELLPPF